ncbi:MAG: hypothetical protein DMG10_14055 [Acidobacteria bacterium]|nr:MAG: hypothetical protein DMG10_14055 [Acidobacteriota bacterium]
MRKYAEILFGGLLFLMVWPNAASAQGGPPPPPCCGHDPSIAAEDEVRATPVSLSTFYASEGTLQTLGLTRTQFLARLSQGLFPGASVDVVLPTSRAVSVIDGVRGRAAAEEAGQVGVEERRYYRLAKDSLQTQALDTFDDLYLTNGEVYVKVTFTREGGHAVP